MKAFAVLVCIAILGLAQPALATQTHYEPEGLVVHQIAHLFFAVSMGTLAYWLGARKLTRHRGWRQIRYAALMLILWNIDAFSAHLLDEQTSLISVARVDSLHLVVTPRPGFEALAPFYYLVKLDHLFCVPALVLLFLGLRRLLHDSETGAPASGAS